MVRLLKAKELEALESRLADLFDTEVGTGSRVVDLNLVEKTISQIGMPDGSTAPAFEPYKPEQKPAKKLYRDTDDRRIAGVCSGLALYFDIDVVLIRILMLIALVMASAGFWFYLILWIAVPKAGTPVQKCELRGLAQTPENLARFN